MIKVTYSDFSKITKLLKKLGFNKKSPIYILIILILILLIGFNYFKDLKKTPNTSQANSANGEYIIDRVVDGDTITLKDNTRDITVRYIGVNTPETVKPNSEIECFGKEASNFNKALVEGKIVTFETDVQNTDQFGRLLRYVYIKDSNGQSIMINKKLVEEGYAFASSYPPNVKYQETFSAAEREARESSKGLWASCKAK